MWVLDVEMESMTLHLVQGEWSIGRVGNVLNFPKDKSISRTHAELHVGGLQDLENVHELPSFTLIDKKSRFGTYLNDVQISPNTPMQLRAGDKITFGAKTTVLRVRYFNLVARTTRIHKVNRKKLLEGCKMIGMHVVNAAFSDVNYCITDPGKFVATEKVLWALVHNHPIVSSDWVHAILRRKSMADELPRCEDFIPQHGQTEDNAPSYGPDPRRFSLYSKYLVVFLAPSSMESLIPIMGGEVVAAHRKPELSYDDVLVETIRKTTARTALIIYPSNVGETGQSEKQSMSRPQSSTKEWDASVSRRLHTLQGLGFTLVLHQELAASIIFTKAPQCLSNESISQLLGPRLTATTTTVEETPPQFMRAYVPPVTPLETVHETPDVPNVPLPSTQPPTVSSTSTGDVVEETRQTSENVSVPDVLVKPSTPVIEGASIPDHDEVEVESVEPAPPIQTDSELQISPTRWLSKPPKRTFGHDSGEIVGAVITTSQLVVRRNLFDAHDEEGAVSIRYLPRHNALPEQTGLRNAKKFKKAHTVTSRRLITHFTDQVPVNFERRREFEKQREELEARERLAEALFETNMQTKQTRRR
ncbi:unnamed protein product [Aphanomyces euteiches]|uniref:FHA domain-containing protein n=1 Tax=Aphanomyces euteiches TaxID=100861 RepID=A0A6G0WS61_9STRA|nr:hypothetical protein Ae201684_012294 [Aphanomyces euteiches]KAH9096625.1 hypothetical protein Ae201684P_013291 [Aphanomyces euteiches]KAH9139259.1 hypothetical protein AeRB84_016459 [Aphanomyces euteiches]